MEIKENLKLHVFDQHGNSLCCHGDQNYIVCNAFSFNGYICSIVKRSISVIMVIIVKICKKNKYLQMLQICVEIVL